MARRAVAILLLASTWALAQDKDSYTIPFELKNHIIIVKGSINGHDGHLFIFDTGASVTCVTPEAAQAAGIKGSGMSVACDSIGAGDAQVKGLKVAIYDPPQAQGLKMMGVNYSGILGYQYISSFVTTFDYPHNKITLVPAARAPATQKDADSRLVPFKTVQNIIILEGKINGKGPQTFIFDSGASETIVTPQTAQALGLGGGNVTLDSISAGDADVKNIPVVIMDPPQAQGLRSLGVDYNGILGHSYFEKFLVTIDYRAKLIKLAPHKSEAAAWLGVLLEKCDKGLRVKGVQPGSPAASMGIQKDDVLTAVNDKALSDPSHVREALSDDLRVKLLRKGKELLKKGKSQKIPDKFKQSDWV